MPDQPYRVSVGKKHGSVDVGVPTSTTAAHRLGLAVENAAVSVTGT
ncbi:MAG TPA: hypothetical protein VG674_02395 [Amycolatopsis sp.]|nr:hypothetical protein [Amycolatopsis sp.]